MAGSEAAARRALGNTAWRAAGEATGKLAVFALVAVLARRTGEEGLGTWLLALTVGQVLALPVEVGIDRLLLREVAGHRGEREDRMWDVLAGKALLLPAMLALALVLGPLLGAGDAMATTLVAVAGVLVESLGRTASVVLTAHERGARVAALVVAQRWVAAALGIAALLAGGGPLEVAVAFLAGALVRLVLGLVLVHRVLGVRPARPSLRRWAGMTRRSVPFGVADGLGLLLFRLDALVLAALATTAAVGTYGAAYRLLDATLFLTLALSSAFSPMFSYLTPASTPSVQEVLDRSLQAAAVVLVPVGVVFVTHAELLVRLAFGGGLLDAAPSLAVLGPVVPLLGLWTLASSFVASRSTPKRLLRPGAIGVAVNLALNLVLVPLQGPRGAALAMLLTMALVTGVVVRLALGEAPGARPLRRLAVPVVAGAAMLAAGLLGPGGEWARLAAAAGAYAAVLGLLGREDLRALAAAVRRRGA